MAIKKSVVLLIASGLFVSGFAAAQSEKPTLESLLAQTLEASEESRATFDQDQGGHSNNALAPNIAFAPAIDISYSEVASNVDQNIGSHVRWGGQVINSSRLNESTVRLTVFAYPLSNEGRPDKSQATASQGGRFVVDLVDSFVNDLDFTGRLLTFYGDVTSGLLVSNGNRQKTIPVIKAEELVDWNMVDQNHDHADRPQKNAYFFLGFKSGNAYSSRFYSPYYVRSRSYYSPRFSRSSSFSRHGVSHRSFRDNQRFNSSRSSSRRFNSGSRFSRRGNTRHRSGSSRRFGRH